MERRFWLTHGYCEYKGIEKINGLMFRYLYPLNKEAERILNAYPEYQGSQTRRIRIKIYHAHRPRVYTQSRRRYLTVMYASSTHRNVEAGFFMIPGKEELT